MPFDCEFYGVDENSEPARRAKFPVETSITDLTTAGKRIAWLPDRSYPAQASGPAIFHPSLSPPSLADEDAMFGAIGRRSSLSDRHSIQRMQRSCRPRSDAPLIARTIGHSRTPEADPGCPPPSRLTMAFAVALILSAGPCWIARTQPVRRSRRAANADAGRRRDVLDADGAAAEAGAALRFRLTPGVNTIIPDLTTAPYGAPRCSSPGDLSRGSPALPSRRSRERSCFGFSSRWKPSR